MALANLIRRTAKVDESRSGLDQWLSMIQTSFTYGGQNYISGGGYDTHSTEGPPSSFGGYVQTLYKGNGVVFAVMLARLMAFSEVRFRWRNLGSRALFGTPSLSLLERPWTNGSTGELLFRMLQDADLAGNSYWTIRNGQLKRLRPDGVTIILGSQQSSTLDLIDLDLEVIGYLYKDNVARKSEILLPNEVAHFSPIPDPDATYRGMSWLTPIISEVMADSATRDHKYAFFRNAATPQTAIVFDRSISEERIKAFKALFDAKHVGAANAYKTMFLGAGADIKVIGSDPKNLDMKAVQGAGETLSLIHI